MIKDETLREYADKLERCGFTIYDPIGKGCNFFQYSRVIDGRECFGYVQKDSGMTSRYFHLMPVHPTAEYGSFMQVKNVPDELSVAAAVVVARPWNTSALVGRRENHNSAPAGIYRRRGSVSDLSTPEASNG